MSRRHPLRRSKQITGAFCMTCQKVYAVKQVEADIATTITLTCSHTVTLWPGAMCRLDVQADKIILYPNHNNLPVQQLGVR